MEIFKTPKLMSERIKTLKREGRRIAFVPTMGALHEGHLSLVYAAKKHAATVVMSIYLNPTQFNNKNDLSTYPSKLEKDLELAKQRGVDIVFCPNNEVMYPKGFQTYVETEEITKFLCGSSRPGHFRGVTTVVAKLFNIVRPDIAIFGEKDYQQLKVIEQMVRDLNLDVEIVGSPIVREADGIAMSSRNERLNPKERAAAKSISQSILHAQELVRKGEENIERIVCAIREKIESTNIGEVDYIKICNPETLEEMDKLQTPALLAIAAHFGNVRLIDNCILTT